MEWYTEALLHLEHLLRDSETRVEELQVEYESAARAVDEARCSRSRLEAAHTALLDLDPSTRRVEATL